MNDFKQLIVWQKAHANAIMVYNLTKLFPKDEQYGLTSQLRRAAVSVPANIAEGCGKFSRKDFAKFLQISLGSAQETEYLSLLSFELGYVEDTHYNESSALMNEVKAMLISLIKKLRSA
jgi:four helix bundle protein